eukprot:TRINITY_DN763_c0_g1_i1.p1 TRINITY_DN763_c0_g1~~TRINITY_DN763_c0_g1_i1.p1  ORF type:complete len:195 (+),score=49.02 TRINITY_DN763_c0_g1_i1:46-630(+)
MCEEVYEVKGQLDSAVKDNNDELVLAHLRKVAAMTITPSDLEETKIGVTMSTLRKSSSNAEISALAKELIKRWKSLLVAQASADGAATVGKKRKIDGADEHAGKDEDESVKRARYFSENADEEDAGGQADEEVGGKMKAPAWFKECTLLQFIFHITISYFFRYLILIFVSSSGFQDRGQDKEHCSQEILRLFGL